MRISTVTQTSTKPKRRQARRIHTVHHISSGPLPAGCQPREDWDSWVAHLAARAMPRELTNLPIGQRQSLIKSSNPAHRAAGEALDLCGRLPDLAASTSADEWWPQLDGLLETARDAAAISLADDPLAHQLLAGELPFMLAALFPELSECSRLADSARAALSRGLGELLDAEGTPAARLYDVLRPLLATWTRCGYIGQLLPGGAFSDEGRAKFDWLVRHALRMTRHDGGQVLTADSPAEDSRGPSAKNKRRGAESTSELFQAALALRSDWEDAEIADCVLPGRKTKRSEAARRELTPPPTHSEAAESGLLRYDWHRTSDFLAVTFHNRLVRGELNCGADQLWSGDWTPHIHVNGKLLQPETNWEAICWHTDDDDVVYLELEMGLTGGWRVQRQILLAGKDRFLLTCDSVLGKQRGEIAYRCTVPISPGTSFEQADETREGLLITGKRRRVVLPLALPEWQAERSPGSLEAVAGGLTLTQSAHAAGLFAPLFFDLDPSRARLPRTWRRLTVAEQLKIVPHDLAAAFRIRIGQKQWLTYRSFRQPSNRSVLGQNVSDECLVARFLLKGEVEELLEIE